jgi:penicillin-binding protein 2
VTTRPSDPTIVEPPSIETGPLRDESRLSSGKIAIFQYSTVFIFLFLISGFWRLQVQNPQFYDERAQANSIKAVPLLAPRGRILDRDGRIIVDNHASFTLLLARESFKPEHLRAIAQGLDLDYDEIAAKVRRFRSRPKYEPIVLKQELSQADLSFVYSHNDFFPELVVTQAQERLYPQDGMLAHVIGYTGEISEQELDMPEFGRYEPGAIVGKFGIERQYNDGLMGVDGQRQVVVDNRGQVRRVLATKPAVPGKDLELTIDLDLQSVAELAMDGREGAVVALDPRTGEVLAMVSRPAFDPNKFASHISAKDWQQIADDPGHPMLNKAIQAQQAPGSTFKPIMALAGLESGSIDDQYAVHCPGGASFYGHYYRCWIAAQHRGHGTVVLHSGIVQSCDVYFYTIGNKMGIDNIAYYATMAGLGRSTGIDLPHENEGIVPSPKWKMRTFRQKWYAGETISVSIGQGALTVTPLQLARAIGGISIGGVWHHPHLVRALDQTEKPETFQLNPDNVKDVIDGMYGVVNEPGGTGALARLAGVEVCGKTGSAQLVSNAYIKSGAGNGEDVRDNGWFVGFAPRSAPEIVVVALLQHAVHGSFAAPVVRDVLAAYFDKKRRISMLHQQQAVVNHSIARMALLGLAVGGAN